MKASVVQTSRWPRNAAANLLLAAALMWFAPEAFAFYNFTVGSDPYCQYSSIQAAVNAAAAEGTPPNFVTITTELSYTNQAITINGSGGQLNIQGGISDCTQGLGAPSGQTKISGSGGHSVFNITGSSDVTISNLEITGGSPQQAGGGIYFGGSGSLALVNDWVHDNTANLGGGIAMNASSASVLSLQSSTISNNQAIGNTNYGGGIGVFGNTTFYSDSKTYITSNSADYGGGIALGRYSTNSSTVTAYISSTVNLNNADYGGGGISVFEGPSLNLFSSDAGNRVSIYGNDANGNSGGGVYLESDGTATTLCAQDFSIDDNTAGVGTAIATFGSQTRVFININNCAPSNPPIAIPAVACTPGAFCNEIADNVARNSSGAATNGGAISLQVNGDSAGILYADRFIARDNTGGNVIYLNAELSGANVQLADCLIANNTETAYDVYALSDAANTKISINSCTFANNTEGGGDMIVAPIALQLTNSIFYEAGNSKVAYIPTAATATVAYDLVGPNNDNLTGTGILKATPEFVDAANGDYHLLTTSPGVDYSSLLFYGGSTIDLDGNSRSVDLPDIPNVYGAMDVGAYEIQTDACTARDTIFCNGFEN